jgi:signal transduction histidine kinase/DNA-binding response OmpR family regulator
MMLTSNYQMWMGWGPELAYLYNDAYRPTLGVKHPDSLAKPVASVWREIWPDIGPLIEKVLRTGEPHFGNGMLLLLERSGYPEETYHTFSYSPLFDDGGSIAGLFCVVVEETERVLNERRLATIRELASSFAAVKTERDLFAAVTARLSENLKDLPFTLTYLLEDEGRSAQLVSATGIEAGHPAAPEHLQAGSSPWPFEALLGNAPAVVVKDLQSLFGEMPCGAWDRPPAEALLVPIAQQAQDRSAAAFLIVGLNPYRIGDQTLKDFIRLLAGQVAAALASVRAYEEERRRAAALAEIDRAKTVFFSNVSHEFRTPLTLMLGPLEDAMSGDLSADEVGRQIELAHRNGTRLLRLVNSLLDFSRIEAGRVQAVFEPLDLAKFSSEIASSFRSAMERAGLSLNVRCDPLPQPAFIDRDMWEKVLLNLLSNAFKFTLEGSVTVTVKPADEGRSAHVSVADTGIGVSPEELPKLFDRFHRVQGAQGRSFEGSGIGLALVQELVRLHGGEITAESTPGQGTTFTVQLPLGRGHLQADMVREIANENAGVTRAHEFIEEALRWLPEAAPQLEAAGELSRPGLDAISVEGDGKAGLGKRVLLADDNSDMRAYVARLLEGQGYHVVTARDGEEALRLAQAAPPDLVLTDVMMPKLDGFGLLRELRGFEPTAGVPIIMLSARAGEEAKVEGLNAGADDYLIKPFAARELVARVNANIQMADIRREANRRVWQSEQRYRITQDRLSRALSTGGVGVFEWLVDEDRLSVIGPLAELYGVDRAESEAVGLPLATFVAGIHEEDRERVQTAVASSVVSGKPYHAEYRVVGAGRESVVLAVGDVEDVAEGHRRMAGVVIDVTELRRAERELQALNEHLEQRVAEELSQRIKAEAALQQAQKIEALGKLTGGVAHDFNNLLQVISGNLQLLSRQLAGNERAQERLENAIAGVARGAKLASQLLAFGRRQPLEPKVVNVGRFIKGMEDMLRRALGEEVEVETVVSGGLWNTLVDPSQIENAILNLAINARDAMDGHGHLTIEASNAMLDNDYALAHPDVTPGQYVMIAVTDTGSGIPQEVLEKVFEPFFSTKPEGRGTGLGLSMVHGFVKQSGGHIKIYSEVGEGTTVKLYLPRVHQKEDVLTDTSKLPVRGGDETILVVEDDDDVRETAVGLLQELGYRVLKARDAASALPIIESGLPIDLLFTDVVMPGPLRSPELARKAKERLPNIAVLFTSGYTENAIVHGGRLDAGVELLAKPYTREQLARKLRQVLGSEAQHRAGAQRRTGPAIPPGPSRPSDGRAMTVLLVEDDDLIRSMTSDMLSEDGHLVIEAGDADEALNALGTRPIDVLLADVGLPRVSGVALAREARLRLPALKIIFATGNHAIADDAGELNAVLLGKPYTQEDLREALSLVALMESASAT